MPNKTLVSGKAIACALAVCVLTSGMVPAQEYSFRNFGGTDGLSNLAIRRIYEDRVGFIWVSTENGIYRYDGDRFEVFGPAQGIPLTSGVAFGAAPDGSLLVGGDFGLYHLSGNRFEKLPAAFKTVSWAQGIDSDGRGHTYIGTESGLMELYSEPGHDGFGMRRIPTAPGVSGAAVYGVLADGDSLWYGCGQQLCRMDPHGITVYGSESGLPGSALLGIQRDREGDLWVRAQNTGVFEQLPGQFRFRRPDLPISDSGWGTTLAVDRDGRILVGSPEGLLIHDEKGWQKINRQLGLRGVVYAAFEDRQHSLWIGLAGRGVAQWRGYREWESYSADSGLGSDIVYEILPQQDGSMWVATEGGLVRGTPGESGMRWKKVPGLDAMPVHSVVMAPSGDLWIGTESKGAARLDIRTGGVEWFGEKQGLSGKSPYTLRFDRQHQLWAATESGLFLARAPYQRFSRIAELPATRIWTVAEGTDGTIWAGSAGGLFAYVSGHWKNWTRANGLSNQEVLALGAGANGTMWVGYRFGGGIDRIHLNPGGVTIENGVQRPGSDGLVYFLDFDRSGRLWVGTQRGVDMWDGSRWSHYDMTDGMGWDDCDLGGFAQGADGTIWIGTSGGLSRFKPRPLASSELPPEVIFTGLQMGQTDVSGERNPAFGAGSGSLIARYSALNAFRENGVVFRYRLEGAGSRWIETTERELQFAQLAPGAYRLEIEAQGREGAWNPHGAEFPFEILTPWYRRWWFVGICVLVPLIVVGIIVRLRFLGTKRRESELLRIVDERTRDLRKANQDLLQLSTVDSLTGLANRRVFDQTLDKECSRVKRTDSTFSLVLFDTDHFKAINDSEGHQRGDEYLVLVGNELTLNARREIDVVARYGGEEFALILGGTDAATAARIAESVRSAIEDRQLPNNASPLAPFLTVSAGVATATRGSWNTPEGLVAAADQALYRAKRSGRNRVEVAQAEIAPPVGQ